MQVIPKQVFRWFILSNKSTQLEISQKIPELITAFFLSMLLISFLYNYKNRLQNRLSAKILSVQLGILIYFIVPITQIHLKIFIKNNYSILIKIVSGLSILIYTIIGGLYLKLKIRPLRKGNKDWKLNNRYQTNRFFINIVRTIIFTIDNISLASLIISFVFQILLVISIDPNYSKHYINSIRTYSDLVLSTYIALIISIVFHSTELGTKIWCILIFISLFKGLNQYIHQSNNSLQFPLCGSSPQKLYNFYFKIYQQNQTINPLQYQSEQNAYSIIFKQHARKCSSKTCPLKTVCIMKKNILSQLQQIITDMLNIHKIQNIQTEILYEMWKLQTGKKFEFRKLELPLNLEIQYIIFTIKTKEFNKIPTNQLGQHQNSDQFNQIFLDTLQIVLNNFSMFYRQIMKPQPKIQTIVQIGQNIRIKVQKIQSLYMDSLKNKSISFKAIQLYIQFQNYFLVSSTYNSELMKKIIMIQKNLSNTNIQQIYLPVLTVYSQTGLIQNVNMECISFLKYSKFQMKLKNINDFLIPNFDIDKYNQLTQQQKQNCLIFAKKKSDQYACCTLKVSSKFINNKKFDVYVIDKQKKQEGKNYILLNQKFQAVKLVTNQQFFKQKRHPQLMVTFIWIQIFQTYIKPHQRQLKVSKMIKLDLKQYNCILMCTLVRTIDEQHHILTIRTIKNTKQSFNQRRSVVQKGKINRMFNRKQIKKFQFRYDLRNQQQIFLNGYKADKKLNNNKSQQQLSQKNIFQNKFSLAIASNKKIQKNLQKGIKTYRLIDDQLYNIDLENKQAYNEQFTGKKQKSQKGLLDQDSKFLQKYIVTLVIILSIILTLSTIYLFYSFNNDMQQIKSGIIKSNQIDRFKLSFYRIISVYRDVASGLYDSLNRQWISDILTEYNNINKNKDKKVFSNDLKLMKYKENQYRGNLNELIEVLLSDIFMITSTKQFELIQHIHETTNMQLTEFIQTEQNQIQARTLISISALQSFKNYYLMALIVGVIFYYFFMVFLCFNLVSQIKCQLHQLMLISDSDSQINYMNSQKLIYAIQMITKKFQFDIKTLSLEKASFKPRRKNKKPIVGKKLKNITFALIAIFFITNSLIILLFHLSFQESIYQLKIMKDQGQNIISVYSDACRQTNYIEHTQLMNLKVIDQLRLQLSKVRKYRTQLKFHQNTNQQIQTYLFQNSCQKIVQKEFIDGNRSCNHAVPSYQIQNPFEIGLDSYFTRLYYNIVDNLTDTFGSTGIYSYSFSKVFTDISLKISNDQEQIFDRFVFSSTLWILILIIINVLYCVASLSLVIYVHKKGQSLELLVKFLGLNKSNFQNQHQLSRNSQNKKHSNSHKKRLSILQNIVY